jgi:hypothetical protein
MPEFYKGSMCRYQPKAQPYLDAIAQGVRNAHDAREFLLRGTMFEKTYADAIPLWQEQWDKRDKKNSMTCPFWSNYWSEHCRSCDCRIDKSVSMEIAALFFLQNNQGSTLAVHIEMKRDREELSLGQAEAYGPRAMCYLDQRRERKTVLPHDHFVTVLFCGLGTDVLLAKNHFNRVILHDEARSVFSGYPTE